MALAQRGLLFTAVQGGGVTPPQTLSVLNVGSGSFAWSASAILLSGGPQWLSVSPASGSSSAGSSPGPVTVTVDLTQLPSPGVYYGLVRISSPDTTNAPQDAEIVLNLLSSDSSPDAVLAPSGLVFTAAAGKPPKDPSSQVFTITNLNASPLQFYVNIGTFGMNWLQAVPNTATIPAGGSQPITVQPTLAEARRRRLQRNAHRTVSGPCPARAVYRAAGSQRVAGNRAECVRCQRGGTAHVRGCTPSQLLPVFTGLPANFSVPAAWPIPLEARVVDDCGTPLTAGDVEVSFDNGDPVLSMLSLNDGRWQATWYGKNSNAKTFSVHLSANEPAPALRAAVKYTATLQTNNSIPAVAAAGVGSAGIAAPQSPLAPGSIISIAGESFAAGQSSASQLPLTTNLGGNQVLLAGQLYAYIRSNGSITPWFPTIWTWTRNTR